MEIKMYRFQNIILVFTFLLSNSVFSQPSINSVGVDSLIHGGILNINGNNFGPKAVPAPLVWDDGENQISGNDPVNDGPWTVEGPTTKYYSTAGLGRNVSQFHDFSNIYIAGGHLGEICQPSQANRNVFVFKNWPATSKKFIAMWKVLLDPDWGTPCAHGSECNGSPNYKDFEAGGYTGYYNQPYFYNGAVDYAPYGLVKECNEGVSMGTAPGGGTSGKWLYKPAPSGPDSVITMNNAPQTDRQWPIQKYNGDFHWNPQWLPEINANVNFVESIVIIDKDNVGIFGYGSWAMDLPFHWGYYVDNVAHFQFDTTTNYDIGKFMVGGYYRYCECVSGGQKLWDDSWRYFDDVYLDTTLARVVLGNADTYDNCTMVEPQIPSGWGASSITVTVNLGSLNRTPGGELYLYVFDRDNRHNPVGYPIPFSGGSSVPGKPTGIQVSP